MTIMVKSENTMKLDVLTQTWTQIRHIWCKNGISVQFTSWVQFNSIHSINWDYSKCLKLLNQVIWVFLSNQFSSVSQSVLFTHTNHSISSDYSNHSTRWFHSFARIIWVIWTDWVIWVISSVQFSQSVLFTHTTHSISSDYSNHSIMQVIWKNNLTNVNWLSDLSVFE